jgi:hypothetical protein
MLVTFFKNWNSFQKIGMAIVSLNLVLAALQLPNSPLFFVSALLLAIVYPWEVSRRMRNRQDPDS